MSEDWKARAEAAEARVEATRAANVDTKMHWDVLKADYDAVCARAEAAEAERDRARAYTVSRDDDVMRLSARADAAEARVKELEAEVRKLREALGDDALHELARRASLAAAKNANTAPELLYAPVLWALQDHARAALSLSLDSEKDHA